MVILVLAWRKSIHFNEDTRENDFYIFIHSGLDLWPLDLKFALLVTDIQGHVSTKWEVSAAFLFQEKRRHGRTDRQRDRRTGCNT